MTRNQIGNIAHTDGARVRPELPPMPPRVAQLPLDPDRGYPVPWFAAWFDADGQPCERGQGKPDYRVVHPEDVRDAHRFELCWICGGRRGAFATFVIGPMCAVNRTSAEPPSHLDCG